MTYKGTGLLPLQLSPYSQVPGIRPVRLQPDPAIHGASHPGDPPGPSSGLRPLPNPKHLGPLPARDHVTLTLCLLQEGWRSVGELVTQRGPLLKEDQVLTLRLQGLMEKADRCILGSSER